MFAILTLNLVSSTFALLQQYIQYTRSGDAKIRIILHRW